jgi:hypothetical protein
MNLDTGTKFQVCPKFSTRDLKFNLEVQIQFGGDFVYWRGGVIRVVTVCVGCVCVTY